jgi:YesN/AraC family two-component response regulator
MKRVLIIDDSPGVRECLREVFKDKSLDLQLASNGLEGLMLQSESPFDLIITDLVMPEMEGIELILKVRRKYPRTRIIAISGANPLYREMALKVGADLELEKPIETDKLLRATEILLENKLN